MFARLHFIPFINLSPNLRWSCYEWCRFTVWLPAGKLLFFFYRTIFDMITEDTIMMQIQYIIENDLFSKGLFFLKWWAGPSCRWLTAHLIRVWHTTDKMRFGLNVWNKRTVRLKRWANASIHLFSAVQQWKAASESTDNREAWWALHSGGTTREITLHDRVGLKGTRKVMVLRGFC